MRHGGGVPALHVEEMGDRDALVKGVIIICGARWS